MTHKVFTLVVALLLAPIAPAQTSGHVHRVGILMHDGAPPGLLEAFREGLLDLGYVEGKDIVLESRDAAGRSDQLDGLANELRRLGVDVILAVNTPAAQAAQRTTATIPIVIIRVADPVKSGLVSNLGRPGANITGLSFMHSDVTAKRIELVKETLPGISRVAVLFNADNPGQTPQVVELERAGGYLGLRLLLLPVRGPGDFAKAFRAAADARAEALLVLDDTAITKHRAQILVLAMQHSLPVVSRYRDFAEAGGLIAYGPDLPSLYRRAAYYVDEILKGARPGELPIEQPTRFDLVVNLKTAKRLGIAVPASVLIRADHVIE